MKAGIKIGEGSHELVLVNPSDRDTWGHKYVLAFGAYGWTRLVVWANHLQDALDEAVDWIADNAPGLLADEQVGEEFGRLVAEGMTEEEAQEAATEDTTCAGNCGHYLLSWEWSLVAEDPSRETMLELLGR